MLRGALSERIGLFFGIEGVNDANVMIVLHGCSSR